MSTPANNSGAGQNKADDLESGQVPAPMFQETVETHGKTDDFSHAAQSRRDSTSVAEDTNSSLESEVGVSRVEAFNKVLYQSGKSGKILLWLLAVSIGLTMFAYALDMGITTNIFTVLASSTFGTHSSLAAVSTASQIIRAISKPFIGKLADITSRPTTYVVILVFYAVGFAVAASANTFTAYTVGICFTSVGKSGLDLLSDIIVGDLTPLEWRGFFGSIISFPFVITVPINGFIAEAFLNRWRWGLGMFAILIPVLLLPAIITLYVMQRRGERLGMVTMAASKRVRTAGGAGPESQEAGGFAHWGNLLWQGLIEIDIAGLIILGFAFSLILLPFTLAKSANNGWSNSSIIAMLVMGFVCLIFFVLFEVFIAKKPIMTKRILQNRAFLAGVAIYTFNQLASGVRNTYFSSYIFVIKDWSTYEWTIFLGVTTMGLSLMGPIVGLIQRKTHRYKSMMLFGAFARMIGYAILVTPNGLMTQDTGRLVASQLIFCLSSFNVVGARVGTQASVPHEDMASIISILTLWSSLGSSVGSAVSSAIWTNEMLDRMYLEMPDVPSATVLEIYGDIQTLRTDYPFGDPVRRAAIAAYSFVNGHIMITATICAVVPLIATFFMPDFYLGKQQNAYTNTGLDGEVVQVPVRDSDKETNDKAQKRSLWQRIMAAYRK